MTKEQKQQIIDSGKDFFREIIIPAHLKNLNEDKMFYHRLAKAFGEVVEEDSEAGMIVKEMANKLTSDILQYVNANAYIDAHA